METLPRSSDTSPVLPIPHIAVTNVHSTRYVRYHTSVRTDFVYRQHNTVCMQDDLCRYEEWFNRGRRRSMVASALLMRLNDLIATGNLESVVETYKDNPLIPTKRVCIYHTLNLCMHTQCVYAHLMCVCTLDMCMHTMFVCMYMTGTHCCVVQLNLEMRVGTEKIGYDELNPIALIQELDSFNAPAYAGVLHEETERVLKLVDRLELYRLKWEIPVDHQEGDVTALADTIAKRYIEDKEKAKARQGKQFTKLLDSIQVDEGPDLFVD